MFFVDQIKTFPDWSCKFEVEYNDLESKACIWEVFINPVTAKTEVFPLFVSEGLDTTGLEEEMKEFLKTSEEVQKGFKRYV